MTRFQLKPAATLQRMILLPIVLTGMLALCVVGLIVRNVFITHARSELAREASALANSMAYISEVVSSSTQLQRAVSSQAGERGIKWILIVDIDANRIIASSSSTLRGPNFSDLPDDLKQDIRSGSRVTELTQLAARDSFSVHAMPLRLTQEDLSSFSTRRALLVFAVDASSSQNESFAFIRTLGLTTLGALLLLLLASFLTLRRYVIIPLKALHSDLEFRGKSELPVPELSAPLEIVHLGRVLHETLDENQKAQESLKAHLELLKFQRFAFDQHSIVELTDTAGNIVYANDRFYYACGFSRDEVLGRNHRLVNSGHHPKSFFAGLFKTVQQGAVWHGEIKNRAKNGLFFWVDTTIVPRMDTNGVPVQYLAMRTDITELKRIEEALAEARDKAEAANQAKSDFLATMSHELRTPMNGIIGFTDVLLDSYLDETQRGQAQIIKRSAESLLVLISDILDFSKIESGHIALENIDFDLQENLFDALYLMAARANEKHLQLDLEIAPDVPKLHRGDPVRLRQVVLNLTANAIKFTSVGSVTVRVKLWGPVNDEHRLRIEIKDTGVGIPTEARDKLFQKFSQADTSTTRKFGGTGLGLAISKTLVELMGGTIDFHSEEGVGTLFWFDLPLRTLPLSPSNQQGAKVRRMRLTDLPGTTARRKPEPAEPPVKLEPLTPPMRPVSSAQTRHVLVVDDTEANRVLAKAFLKKLGCTTDEAADGHEAITRMNSGAYDLVLMDCHMPEKDGCIATMEFRMQERQGSHLKIIALSANHDDRERCLLAGMDEFLPKPVRKDDLRRIIEAM